ncbi:MAG TPA: type II toxin-antitoxin system prevent-host-death family antitoxin, partial [Candidatus Nitrosocosmicus sp.]|nr:type II toxin-antitoxin system prevent-host-death family antitoxin [Candidatus Nitrosocosmicus sp.]
QRNSKDIVDRVKESTQPYFVMRNNKPEMVMISMDEYEELKKFKREFEMESALKAVAEYKKEKKAGTLKELKGSLYDLWKELQNEDKN